MVQSRFLPVMSIQTALRRFKEIEEFVSTVMEENEDFGMIPGARKRSLWKPGAEKLCSLFGLVPRYESLATTEDWSGERHGGEPLFYYRVRCSLWRDGYLMGEGEGSCNSWESKYRTRHAERECPVCGKAAIIKGKAEYGGGYVCFQKKGGCGAKFTADDPAIGEQRAGKIANPEIFDLVNTVLKMANKRAQIAATLNATGASRFFTQDEDVAPEQATDAEEQPTSATPKSKDFAMLRAFAAIKKEIGSESYYILLNNNGFQHADEILDVTKARAIYAEMKGYLNAIQEQKKRPSARDIIMQQQGGEQTPPSEGEEQA